MPFEIDPDLLGLVDEVALVTGGGGIGMGRAHCVQLARAGCHIVVADMDVAGGQQTVRDVEALGRKAVFIETNTTDAAQVQRMVQTAYEAFGRLDVAVNHVGGAPRGTSMSAPFLRQTDEDWENIVRMTLLGTVSCCRAEAQAMIEHQTPGRIINVSSTTGVVAGPMMSAYGAAKAGVIHLTKTLAVELGPNNIRVNCIVPGFHPNERMPGISEAYRAAYNKATPLRRHGEGWETAGLAVAFASKLTSYVTGQTLASDGGVTIVQAYPEPQSL